MTAPSDLVLPYLTVILLPNGQLSIELPATNGIRRKVETDLAFADDASARAIRRILSDERGRLLEKNRVADRERHDRNFYRTADGHGIEFAYQKIGAPNSPRMEQSLRDTMRKEGYSSKEIDEIEKKGEFAKKDFFNRPKIVASGRSSASKTQSEKAKKSPPASLAIDVKLF